MLFVWQKFIHFHVENINSNKNDERRKGRGAHFSILDHKNLFILTNIYLFIRLIHVTSF